MREMADIAPMLSVLGYDPYANPPVYGAPDSLVSDNTKRYIYVYIYIFITPYGRYGCYIHKTARKQMIFKQQRTVSLDSI